MDGYSTRSLPARLALACTAILVLACGPLPTSGDAGLAPLGDGAPSDDDAAVVTDDPDAAIVFSDPTLVTAHVVESGRFGDDLRITVRASDADGDATSLGLAMFDDTGMPLVQFDGNGDGVLDTHETIVPMAQPITGPGEGDGLVVLPGFYLDVPELASVGVRVLDARGGSSVAQRVDVVVQPIVELDGVCDPSFVTSRCASGLGCPAAVPSVCIAGSAPVLSRVAYIGDPGAVRVLVEGSDVDDDVSELDIAFFDAAGDSVELDLDGDGIPESAHFGASLRDISMGGSFFYAFAASDVFRAEVASVSVIARDRGMHASDPIRASAALAPVRASGQPCDVRGFDRCAMSVCMPAGATAYHCVATSAARATECSTHPTLDAFGGPGFIEGTAEGASLWDAPSGCSSGDPVGRPEGTLRLHLDRHASSVVLSTDNAYTSFDTTIYAMASCSAPPIVAWCADDLSGSMRSWLSRLELLDVPAGDYVVVVDSFAPAGGHFRLDVVATE